MCPDYPENFTNNAVKYLDGRVIVRCDPDHVVTGDNSYCLPNGTWTALPSCVRKSCPPISLRHGVVEHTEQNATVTCNEGFTLHNDRDSTASRDSETVTCDDGSWRDVPMCIRDCSVGAADGVDVNQVGDLSKPVKITIQRCDFTSGITSNYTKCLSLNYTVTDTRFLSPYTDTAVSISKEGTLCVRYGHPADCARLCDKRGLIKLTWYTTRGKYEYIQVDSNFDYSVSAISCSLSSSLSYSILVLVLFIFLQYS